MIPSGTKDEFSMTYKLPAGMTCTQCVIQWKYHTGNHADIKALTFSFRNNNKTVAVMLSVEMHIGYIS